MAERRTAQKKTSSRGSSSSGGSSGGRGSSSSGGSSGRGSSSSSRSSNGSSRSRAGSGSRSRSSSNKNVSGREAVERAYSEASDLLGRQIESVLGLESDDDKGWKVTLEVVELERIPRSTDVLGAYVIALDKGGELIGCNRERRYYRNQADED